MDVTLSPREARVLSEVVLRVEKGAWELSRFEDTEPGLAGECGIEVGALEARTILSGGSLGRLKEAARSVMETGRPVVVRREDLETLSRLEGVLSLADARISVKVAAISAGESQEGMLKLGSIIGLATGAVGLWKSIF
jgi:hypothetical protein